MEWPLVGRREHLARIVAALASRNGGGLVVHGPAGVGKTRLLTEARDRAAAGGADVRWILATAASCAVPFGPFVHVLPASLDPGQPGGLVSAVASSLSGLGRPVALAVDDAHLLDAGSAALLQHLAQATRIAFVVTVRDGEPAPDAVTALWKDLGIPRLGLTDLDGDEVSTALAEALAGDVSSSLVDELARLSHGNPLLLRELVDAATRTGAIGQRNGVWTAVGPLVGAGGLPATIAERLDRLPLRVRGGAELVALAEPVGASIVEELLDKDLQALLDEDRLLATVPDRRRVQLRLVHPLYTEALRATVPPLRAREHARRLAQGLARTGMRRKGDRLRVAVLHLAAGRRDDPGLYLAACGEAHAAEDHRLAAQLAEAAVDGGGGLDAELALVHQLPYIGRLEEALARAGQLAGAVIDPRDAVAVGAMRAHLNVVAGDLATAERLLREAQAVADTPELEGRLLVQLVESAGASGNVARTTDVIDEILASPLLGPELIVTAAPGGVRALGLSGRAEDGVALADRALDAIDEHGSATGTVRDGISMARCHALAYAGRLDQALASGQAGAAASRGGLRGAWLRDVGQALLLTGRPRSGLIALREMMAELPLTGMTATSAMWSLDAMAEACALLGDLHAARRHLDELARRRPTGFLLPRTSGAVWAAAAGGELRRARDIALEAAAAHAARGARVPQAQALYDVARLGAPGAVVGELAALAAVCQGNLVRALALAARGLAERDADALDACSLEFQGQGLLLLAAEVTARSSTLHRQDGHGGKALAADRRAAGLASACEGARTPMLDSGEGSTRLTQREWEVANLVAQALPDREVAERLHVSVRTVHSHLHSIYRKLDVRGREELARSLGDPGPRDEDRVLP